jgi:hypothetical protein
MILQLTKAEQDSILKLHALAKDWPESLWLFSANGILSVMQKKDGRRVLSQDGGMDPAHSVATIDIENDGGDW